MKNSIHILFLLLLIVLLNSVYPSKSLADISETEILIKSDATKEIEDKNTSNIKYYLSYVMIGSLVALGFYLIKKRSFSMTKNNGMPKIKILDQHYIGPKKSLAIITVSGESILIGITDQNISMIKSLSLIDDEIPESAGPVMFQSALSESEDREFVQKDLTEVGQYIGLSRFRNKIL